MISQESIACYKGISLSHGSNFLFIPPHFLLQPYIANYTISFPTSKTMPDEYTILPTASSTLTISVSSDRIIGGIRGVNTKACNVGAYANKLKLLLLIEFHPGGLYHFIRVDQFELVDSSFMLDELDKMLAKTLENELTKAEGIETLVEALDRIFVTRLRDCHSGKGISAFMHNIFNRHGNISTRELSSAFCYSEKQIHRLFMRHIGTSPKMFSRIVRVNYALRLLQQRPQRISEVAVQAGFFDQPHFIHDFKTICGVTPQGYKQNMSVFYNDRFKMKCTIGLLYLFNYFFGGWKMNQEIIARAGEIVEKNTGEASYCVLALIDPDGYPTASTITASKADGINWITFCTGLGGTKTNRIDKCHRASVCFNAGDYNITLVGTVEILTDPDVKKEMWYGGLVNHFSGPEDPDYCVLRFRTERYNLFVDWKEARGSLQV